MLRIRSTGLVAGLLVITGCAWFPTFDDVVPDKQKEYLKSQSLPDLEVPPDLTTESIRDTLEVPDVDPSGAASYSTYQERIAQRKREAGSAESGDAAKPRLPDATLPILDTEPAETAQEPAADPAPRPKPKIPPAASSGEPIHAELLQAGEGKAYLRVSNDFAKVWRNTGFALGQIGAKVEDEDRSRGSYYLRFSDTAAPKPEKGFLSSLAFWRDDNDDEFEIHLTDVGNNTEVIVLDPDGNWDNSAAAARILQLLLAELNE